MGAVELIEIDGRLNGSPIIWGPGRVDLEPLRATVLVGAAVSSVAIIDADKRPWRILAVQLNLRGRASGWASWWALQVVEIDMGEPMLPDP